MKLFKVNINHDDTTQQIRERLLYAILFLLSVLGLPTLIVAGIEAYSLHQFSTILIYILFFIPVTVVTIFRKQLNYKTIVYVVVGFGQFVAIGNVVTYGFGGAGIPIFFSLFVFTTIFFNQKAGLFMILFSAFAMCIIGFLYITHRIALDGSLDEISTKLISWVTALSVLVFLGALIVFSFGLIQEKMLQSIEISKLKSEELKETIIQLNRDIQEKIKTQLELKNSEARFSSLIEQSGDAMYLSDFDGNIIAVNKKACDVLGYERADLVQLNVSDIDVNYIERADPELLWAKLGLGETQTLETTHKCKDGKLIAVEVILGLYEFSNKKSILGFARDVSNRKQIESTVRELYEDLENKVNLRTVELEKKSNDLKDSQNALLNIVEDLNEKSQLLEESARKLENINKELESFSYSVSHDLRAPLRGIDGFSLALLEDYSGILDEQGKNYLSRVRKGTQKMALLIDEMLNLSRLGRMELKPTTVNLSEIAQSISKDLHASEQQRPAEFIIEKDVICMADPTLMRAVLQNLLENAWKFTSKKSTTKIEFGVLDFEGKTTYFVRDNGAGFNMKYKNKLFVPFQRLHQESEFPGTGIGLTTVQRIIHRHNGTLWAESEIDAGATFYFTLNV